MSGDDPQGSSRPRQGPVVRPYAITGGRARPRHDDLEVEALVSSSYDGELASYLSWEKRTVIRLCLQVRSVAELAAHLDMPLGVARVLLADMAYEGLVTIYRPAELIGDHPDTRLLARVLDGLRNI